MSQSKLLKDWIFLGEGTYNRAYKSIDGTEVLKIQKYEGDPTDTPERSVRLWNAINSHIHPPAKVVQVDGRNAWVCPFIEGNQASDKEMAEALIDIFNKTGRVVVDAVGHKNFVKTFAGQVVCIDIGMALEFETRENIHFAKLARRKSVDSLATWRDSKAGFEPFFKQSALIYPETINVVKALVFIKNNRPDIYDATFLKTNPDLVRKLAKAYDMQNRENALANLDVVVEQERLEQERLEQERLEQERLAALSPIERYNHYLTKVEANFENDDAEVTFKSQKEAELFQQGQKILKQVKSIAGDDLLNLSQADLKDLTDVLNCVQATWDDHKNKERTTGHAQGLADLSQRVSGKSSPGWKALGIGLLTFACLTLVAVGVLAAIPSGGSSLLLTAIGAAGLAATASVGAGVAAAGVVGTGALIHGREKGLAKSVSQFKEKLTDLKDDKEQGEDLNNSPSYK